MSIVSIIYIAFLLFVIFSYFLLDKKIQWIWLLLISLFFYFANAKIYTFIYVLITLLTTYFAAIIIEKNKVFSKGTLIATIVINLLILIILKYSNMLIDLFNFMFAKMNINYVFYELNLAASLGISYYTLQMISYLLECYWGQIAPEKNIFKLLLFMIYFPQMIAGPICRYKQTNGQLFCYHEFDYYRITNGLIRVIWGIFQKRVIAERLAIMIDVVYSDIITFNGLYIWMAVLLFPLQLYTDFNGCMDIVLGSSECLGIKMPENFKTPFFSNNIQEFWQRWHITLGSYLRDYVMYPLLKSNFINNLKNNLKNIFGKKTASKIIANLSSLAVWICVGLWHGSNLKYVLGQGLWYWLIIVLEQIIEPIINKHFKNNLFLKLLRMIKVYLLFAFGSIFFRASSLAESFIIIKSLFNINCLKQNTNFDILKLDLTKSHLVVLLFGIVILFVVDIKKEKGINIIEEIRNMSLIKRWIIYLFAVCFILLSYVLSSKEFLYSQF